MPGLLAALLAQLCIAAPEAPANHRDGAEIYRGLRNMVFETQPSELGLSEKPDSLVWGVVTEFRDEDFFVTLVALADGTVSLYLSDGGGFIGLGQHEGPRRAAGELLKAAEARVRYGTLLATSFPPPRPGKVRFYLLTFRGVLTVEQDEASLLAGRTPWKTVFSKAIDLLTEVRRVDEARRSKGEDREPRGAPAE